jgi:hypothetical protein
MLIDLYRLNCEAKQILFTDYEILQISLNFLKSHIALNDKIFV